MLVLEQLLVKEQLVEKEQGLLPVSMLIWHHRFPWQHIMLESS